MSHATNKSSGVLAVQNAVLNNGTAILDSVNITAAAADVVVTIYDNGTAGSGTIIFQYTLDFTLVGLSVAITNLNIRATNGLWVVITGTGGEAIVSYK